MFDALADGGQVQMPLAKTFFSPRFGMVADRFGMGWMVIALPPEAAGQSPDFVISRVFDAPRELVWKCFTEPERMKHWWGPKGFKVIASKMDLRPGGYLPLRAEGPRRHVHVGQVGLSRDRAAAEAGVHQLVLG